MKGHSVGKFGAQGVASMLLVKLGERAIEHGLADDQFADKIHNRIDARGIHAKGAFGNGTCSRTGDGGLCGSPDFSRLSGTNDDLSGLRFQQLAEQFMFGRFRGGGALKTHVRDDGRNAAALEKLFFRLRTGQGGFYNFHGGGSEIVFRAQSDKCAAAMKNVANELKSSSAHQAIGIDAKSDVVNGLATMHSFRNHELLVFGPGKLRRQLGHGRTGAIRRSGFLQQFPNHSVERIRRWGFLATLVRRKHGAKTIGRRENQFS